MRILETVLYAEDLVAERAFYVDFLGLELILFDPDRGLFMRGENGVFIVFKSSKTLIPDTRVPPHGTTGPGHMAFSATPGEIESWRSRLVANDVPIIQEVEWKPGVWSIYFHDPAGNIVEFADPRLWEG